MDADSKSKRKVKIPAAAESTPFAYDTILWLILFGATLYYTDIVDALMIDSRISGLSYKIAVSTTATAVLTALYYIVWCSFIKGIHSDDWEKYAPYGIPFATGCGVLSGICWTIALWGVYGIKSPIIVFILFMGFVMSVSILPPWSKEATHREIKTD